MGTLTTTTDSFSAAVQRRAAFEDRYGVGSFERLLRRLEQPCIPFAQIANQFGVSRERVRQWQREWLPDAPTGLQRRRLCAAYQEKKRLMLDGLFREFHRHARTWFGAERIHPVRTRRGYRAREVRIDQFVVALRDATTSARGGADLVRCAPRYRGGADFVYFRLHDNEFLFVAANAQGPTHPRNSFAALEAPVATARDAFTLEEHSL